MKYSAIAGSLAASAGMLGKLGADGDTGLLLALTAACEASSFAGGNACGWMQSLVRVAFIGLMLATNCFMLSFFVKGLHETDSLTATVTSAAVNFMLSAAGGALLFDEGLPMQWFAGATIILVGMGLLLYGDTDDSKQDSQKPKQS